MIEANSVLLLYVPFVVTRITASNHTLATVCTCDSCAACCTKYDTKAKADDSNVPNHPLIYFVCRALQLSFQIRYKTA